MQSPAIFDQSNLFITDIDSSRHIKTAQRLRTSENIILFSINSSPCTLFYYKGMIILYRDLTSLNYFIIILIIFVHLMRYHTRVNSLLTPYSLVSSHARRCEPSWTPLEYFPLWKGGVTLCARRFAEEVCVKLVFYSLSNYDYNMASQTAP